MKISKDRVREALAGDAGALYEAFPWKETRQGFAYWQARWSGEVPMDINDRTYLRMLLGHPPMTDAGREYLRSVMCAPAAPVPAPRDTEDTAWLGVVFVLGVGGVGMAILYAKWVLSW